MPFPSIERTHPSLNASDGFFDNLVSPPPPAGEIHKSILNLNWKCCNIKAFEPKILAMRAAGKTDVKLRIKKYLPYKGEVGKIAPNLLERNFEAAQPNQKWVTDITEFSLFGQKLYLSPILDLCSRDIVSYSISDRPMLSMVAEMLDKAFKRTPDGTNLILHSDLTVPTQKVSVEQLYEALDHLPPIRARRVYAHYILGMKKVDIARVEGVNEAGICDSVKKGVKNLRRYSVKKKWTE